MINPIFGKRLRLNIESIRESFGRDEFTALLQQRGINLRMVQDLIDGSWKAINHRTLLTLAALAEHSRIPLVEVSDSPLWQTFRSEEVGSFVLAGMDVNDSHFGGDFEVAKALNDAGLNVAFKDVPLREARSTILRHMKEKNVVAIGSSKNNPATEVALQAMWEGRPPVKFFLPNIRYRSKTIEESPDGTRMVEVLGEKHCERGAECRLGIVAAKRGAAGNPLVTTVVIAGCSKEATYEMVNQLKGSDFYHQFSQDLEQISKRALLFLFDSSKQDRWRLIGAERRRRKPGRPAKNLSPSA